MQLQPLQKELNTFKKNKKELLVQSKGQFVLIKNTEVIGTFKSYEDALSEGYKRFGNEPFLVKEVSAVEEVNYFTRPNI